MESIELPSTLKRIEYNAFKTCTNLKNVSLPESLRRIGNNAFFACKRLRRIELAERSKLEEIGDFCFYDSELEEVTLPRMLKTIGCYTFNNC